MKLFKRSSKKSGEPEDASQDEIDKLEEEFGYEELVSKTTLKIPLPPKKACWVISYRLGTSEEKEVVKKTCQYRTGRCYRHCSNKALHTFHGMVSLFIKSRLLLRKDAATESQAIYDEYVEWCEKSGEEIPVKDKGHFFAEFNHTLRDRISKSSVYRGTLDGRMCYRGVALKSCYFEKI